MSKPYNFGIQSPPDTTGPNTAKITARARKQKAPQNSPTGDQSSGIYDAMSAHADKMHPVKK